MNRNLTLQQAVLALMRSTGLSADEAHDHLWRAIRNGTLPLHFEDTLTKESGRVPLELLGPKLH